MPHQLLFIHSLLKPVEKLKIMKKLNKSIFFLDLPSVETVADIAVAPAGSYFTHFPVIIFSL